jgi:hypothetical protein
MRQSTASEIYPKSFGMIEPNRVANLQLLSTVGNKASRDGKLHSNAYCK